MLLDHLVGLYTHPKQEWHTIDEKHEGIGASLSHLLIVAILPPVCAYISSVFIGWQIGVGDPIFLTAGSAIFMAIGMYIALVSGVFALGYLTYWMSRTFGSEPEYTQCFEVAVYTATPLFMSALGAFYPHIWFLMMVGLVGLSFSVYLLYTGVPILMHIPEDRGFIYASSVVTCGLVLLVTIMASSVILWNFGFGPQFVS
ncbi:Yip1 family protein [Thaumasiovibrio subtropicus]|uniref:Yip1 family protein n=1 Tax=Thaumasiovibrio subtropicus TaxID=1891207 RepID=UPI000B3589B6|nr:Yip1 family protein [Thaumasiovibrio subtropicus]